MYMYFVVGLFEIQVTGYFIDFQCVVQAKQSQLIIALDLSFHSVAKDFAIFALSVGFWWILVHFISYSHEHNFVSPWLGMLAMGTAIFRWIYFDCICWLGPVATYSSVFILFRIGGKIFWRQHPWEWQVSLLLTESEPEPRNSRIVNTVHFY